MINQDFLKKVKNLPIRQQVALWVILDSFYTPNQTAFSVSDFAEKAKRYFTADTSEEMARMMGGIMSSLLRNEMIERLSGGQKPIWALVSELHRNANEYKQSIFSVTTYWGTKKNKR